MDMVSFVITRLNDICQELFIPKGMYFLYYSCGIEKISNILNEPSFIINLIKLAKISRCLLLLYPKGMMHTDLSLQNINILTNKCQALFRESHIHASLVKTISKFNSLKQLKCKLAS